MTIVKRNSDLMKNLSQFFYQKSDGMVSLNRTPEIDAEHMKIFYLESKIEYVKTNRLGGVHKNKGQSFAFSFYYENSHGGQVVASWRDQHGKIKEASFLEDDFKSKVKDFSKWIKASYQDKPYHEISMLTNIKDKFNEIFLSGELLDKEKDLNEAFKKVIESVSLNSSLSLKVKEILELKHEISEQLKRLNSDKELNKIKKTLDDLDEQIAILQDIRSKTHNLYQAEYDRFYKNEDGIHFKSKQYSWEKSALEEKYTKESYRFFSDLSVLVTALAGGKVKEKKFKEDLHSKLHHHFLRYFSGSEN